jgi:protoheme IX farnesyltransferase
MLLELSKARLTSLVLVTTVVGFYAGTAGSVHVGKMLGLLAGTALLASGAAALNQWMEREWDGRMPRTRNRPLPSGRIQPGAALVLGLSLALAGLVVLAATVNPITTLLGALTAGLYLVVYTPLKRITPLNTLVGAVPGALPPVMGWTAARGELSWEGLGLFAVLFCWQIPHFMALAWIYREQYAQAGFVMLPAGDQGGKRTARWVLTHSVGLLAASVLPYYWGWIGAVPLAGAVLLGAGFCGVAWWFSRALSLASARGLFFTSIIYLPALLGLLVLGKASSGS